MGTKHLTLVQHNNKIVVAQYGQWDGYPKGQGKTVLNFLTTVNLNKFKKQLNMVYFIDDTSPTMKKVDKAIERYYKLHNTFAHIKDYRKQEKATLKAMHPDDALLFQLFTRDTGAKILDVIYKANTTFGIPLYDASDFAGNSLFCEWAYLVNLDENTLEVYRGFNRQPLNTDDRFYGAPIPNEQKEFRPIKLLKTFKFNRLPKEENFYKTLETLKNKFDKINDEIGKSLTPLNTKE